MPADHRAGPASQVFLSYRRKDSGYQADTLYRLLVDVFGP
ncbi:MAG: hypothetical protein QOD68_603, partial [Actinomycetota bacterium]|nr:hypothetical protein [Actinomycetota bacterium]